MLHQNWSGSISGSCGSSESYIVSDLKVAYRRVGNGHPLFKVNTQGTIGQCVAGG